MTMQMMQPATGLTVKFVWTDELVEQLKTLWVEHSAAECARIMACGVSRNAVIGKVFRLGLTCPSDRPRVSRGPRAPRAPRRLNVVHSAPIPAPEPVTFSDGIVFAAGSHVTTEMLSGATCHWPVGDPQNDNFHFCGHETANGRSYCLAHFQAAHRRGAVS